MKKLCKNTLYEKNSKKKIDEKNITIDGKKKLTIDVERQIFDTKTK